MRLVLTNPQNEVKVSTDMTNGLVAALEAVEAVLVAQAMEDCHQNQVRAAEKLKISRGALQYKLKKYGLSQPAPVEVLQQAA